MILNIKSCLFITISTKYTMADNDPIIIKVYDSIESALKQDLSNGQLESLAHNTLIYLLNYTDLNEDPYPKRKTYDSDIKMLESAIELITADKRFVNQDNFKSRMDSLWGGPDIVNCDEFITNDE
jgi:hypothetical protein